MNQTEVICPEVQGDSGFQVDQLAGEGQGEPVKSSNLHSQRQILPLDIGRTDLAVIRNPNDICDFRPRYARWRIAARARILRGVKLGDGGIRGSIAKVATDGRTIVSPGISTDLCRPFNAVTQILDESVRIDRITLPDVEGGDELGYGVQGNICVLVPKFRVGFPLVGFHHALFFADERPDFITLDGFTANAVHLRLHHLFALGADLDQELHDRFLVHASHADNGADRTALGERGDNSELLFWLQDIHGTSLAGDPGRCIVRITLAGVIRFDLRGTYRVAAAWCYKHWAANLQTMVPGVSFELTTYGLAIASLSPFELPRHSSSSTKFPIHK